MPVLAPASHGPIDRRAPRERIQLDEGSWVDLVRGFARDTEHTFERLLREVSWQHNREIRGGRKVDDPRLTGSLPRAQADADPMFRYARLVLEARYRVRLTGPHLVLYRHGRDSMGFHRDDEMRWLDRTIITGLALGATRPFVLRPIRGGRVRELSIAAGDLYVMGGRCQADWLHGVPKQPECGPKISVVWRWTSRTGPPVTPYRG
ncbi:MAG: alpha-ketoglutarate-dependent dioxygenase AlkB [Nannocystaceae bacterium]